MDFDKAAVCRFQDVSSPEAAAISGDDPFTYLASLDSMGIRLGLDPMLQLLGRLKNPQKTYRTILIGGTNGKGSIAAITASILRRNGCRVGLYTSPHLVHFRERIRVDDRMITDNEIIACIRAVKRQVRESVTWFEFVTAMAFHHFRQQHVEIAVIEVGMGGRLDATNVTHPMVSVISNISLEHRAYLGHRLQQIAGEKAGIIGEKGICITAAKQPQVIGCLEEICRQKGADLIRKGRDFRIRKHRDGTLTYWGSGRSFHGLTVPLKGRHQLDNAAVALAVIEAITKQGIEISERSVCEGMNQTRWEGRLEVLRYDPVILLDGAHNPAGISALCRTLREDFRFRRLILIFGALSDKSVGRMLGPLCRLAHEVILTRPDTERALSPDLMLQSSGLRHKRVRMIDEPCEALRAAIGIAGKNDLICVTGSLYLVGAIKKAFPFLPDYDKRKSPSRQ